MLTAVALVLPSATTAQERSPLLDEREAIRRTLSRAPLADALEGSVDAARADEISARTWRNPVASYGYEQTRGDGTTAREHTGTLSVPLEISGARALRGDAAAARVRAAGEEVRRERTTVAAEARRRFFAVLWRDRRAAALATSAARLEAVASAAERREASGDVSSFDAARIAAEREAQRARAAAESAAAARSRALLAATLGEPLEGAASLALVGELSPGETPKLAAFIERVLERGDVRALRAQEQAGELAARAAARAWIPSIEVGGGVKHVTDGNGGAGTGPVVGISIPLPLLDRAQGDAVRARAEQRRAAGRSKLLAAEATATVAGLHAEASALAEVARRSQGEAWQRAEVLVSAADAGYRGGELGAVELVDAYRAALDAELQQIDLAWNARDARISLDEAAGLAGDEEQTP